MMMCVPYGSVVVQTRKNTCALHGLALGLMQAGPTAAAISGSCGGKINLYDRCRFR
jgi:hypothetical protein